MGWLFLGGAVSLGMLLIIPLLVPCPMLAACRYDGPLEYLTMWLCLFLSPGMCELLKELHEAGAPWRELPGIRETMSTQEPINPHPLDVLRRWRRSSLEA